MATKKCLRSTCRGKPRPTRITETYKRKGSPVVVTIRNIPAVTCAACGFITVDDETFTEIERLLDLFQKSDLALPPAKVELDYKLAVRVKQAA